jgi:DNA polymerase-1
MEYVLVTQENEDEFLQSCMCAPHLSVDTETTSLRPFHGGSVFAVVVCNGSHVYYFQEIRESLRKVLGQTKTLFFGHNFKFDLHFLNSSFGATINGALWDTMVGARLEYNDHIEYNLDACAQRIGLTKDDTVKKYILDNDLWEWVEIPGKKQRKKNLHFDKVPFEIMFQYACRDAEITYKLGMHQIAALTEKQKLLPKNPGPMDLMLLEEDVTKTLWEMESKGLKVDRNYIDRALVHEEEKATVATNLFYITTGRHYQASPKLFQEVFSGEKSKWKYTEKGNPSFESDALKKFKSGAAKEVLRIRDAKSRQDFYRGFLYHSDKNDFIHPNFNQAGTRTGRFSSSEPNFQNLTEEEGSTSPFKVRQAIVPPSPEHCIVSIDYDQQEYRMMLDYAGEMEVIEQVKSGVDVHQATANIMGVSRKEAKTVNFLLLYGGGALKLANELGRTESEAKNLRSLYFEKLPNVQKFIRSVIGVAETRGYIINWAGRRYYFERDFCYKAPNTLIQGGGSDVMRHALVRTARVLKGTKSYPCLTVHDELDFYMHRDDLYLLQEIKGIMENIYPSKHLKLTCSISHSWQNLSDLKEGEPVETRDEVSDAQSSTLLEDTGQFSIFSNTASVH